MSDELEYVTKNAILECSEGAARTKFTPDYNTKVKIMHVQVATAMDNKPMENIPDFVMCRKTGSKCIPMPAQWEDTYPVKVLASRTLLVKSHCKCLSADGKITFLTSGQVPLPPDAEAEFSKQRQDAGEELKKEEDSIGEPGFWTGLIPLYGSGRSLIHDVQVGHWGWAVADLGFLVWDVVDVAAFILTLPAGGIGGEALTALETSAKAAMKGGKAVLAKTTKFLTKEALRETFSKVVCVTACFVKGTLVVGEKKMIPIEELKISDKIWTWDEVNNKLELSEVSIVTKSVVSEICEISLVNNEKILCTPEHPFLTVNGWVLASQLEMESGHVLDKNLNQIGIIQIHFHTKEETVYEIEIEEYHSYLITNSQIIVHNACAVLEEIYKLLGKQTLTKTAEDLLKVIKAYRNKIYKLGKNVIILDKQGLAHILGRHHPSFKLDGKEATMFAREMGVKDIEETIGKMLEQNPDKVSKALDNLTKGGSTSFQAKIDGVLYQIGLKDKGHIGQFFKVGD